MTYKKILSLLLAGCMVFGFAGCGSSESDDSSSEETTSAENGDSSEEDADPSKNTVASIPVSDWEIQCDSVDKDLATTIANYYYSIEIQDYDLYQEQMNSAYRDAMEPWLQDNYGYGIETSFEQYYDALVDAAETSNFALNGVTVELAEEALADDFEEDTDFIQDYLDTYSSVLGDDFVTTLENESKDFIDVAVTLTAVDEDGETFNVLDQIEVLVVEQTDGSYSILG